MNDRKAADPKNFKQGSAPLKIEEEPISFDSAQLQPVAKKSGGPVDFPNTSNARKIRLGSIQLLQQKLGNSFVSRFLSPGPDAVQREVGEGQGTPGAGAPAAASPGTAAVQNATEQFYAVTGPTLDSITGQLNHLDGRYAAQTITQLGMSTTQVTPDRLPDRTLRVEVPWSINGAVTTLPRWTNYAEACQAAQGEWDRFMRQTRLHEHEAHVVRAHQFIATLTEADRVVTGRNAAALQRNMVARRQQLRTRLQTMHDGCDHGASIDAILHPDNGRCP